MTTPEEPRENPEVFEASESSLPKFCALEYRGQDWDRTTSVILLVLEDGKGGMRFLIHPDWRAIAHAEDMDYIESLLQDFLERAKLHPEALFKQLSSLGVGLLVAHEAGESISEYPVLLELCSKFVQL